MFIAGSIENADECQWYCMTYIADSTFGTFFNILYLKTFEACMLKLLPDCTIMNFGEYGTPPQLCVWFPQLIVWMTIITVAKICTLYIVYQFIAPLNVILSYVFDVFNGQPELELIVVMIIIPTILNTVQFWITDTFLMKQPAQQENSRDGELDEGLITQVREYICALFRNYGVILFFAKYCLVECFILVLCALCMESLSPPVYYVVLLSIC